MERKKSKSKSIFSIFALDWDDKPKSKKKPEKILYASSKAGDHGVGSFSVEAPSEVTVNQPRVSGKLPPQPAPRVRGKSERPETSRTDSVSKHHHGVVEHRTESPYPSPHLAKKVPHMKQEETDDATEKKLPKKSGDISREERNRGEMKEKPGILVAEKSAIDRSTSDGLVMARYSSVGDTGEGLNFPSDRSAALNPPFSGRVAPQKIEQREYTYRKPSHQSPSDSRQSSDQAQTSRPLTNNSKTAGTPDGATHDHEPARSVVRESEQHVNFGHDGQLRVSQWAACEEQFCDKVESSSASKSQAKEVRSDRKSDSHVGMKKKIGSLRNLEAILNRDDSRNREERSKRNDEDWTFESAILSLIRLRRLEAKLRYKRDRYLQELQLFRGWSNDGHT